MSDLVGAKLKIDRANRHILEFHRAIEIFGEENPYQISPRKIRLPASCIGRSEFTSQSRSHCL